MPYVDLYGLGFTRRSYQNRDDWVGATTCANSILQAVRKKYIEKRLDIVWRRSCSLPSYRFPYPYPIHNQSWSATYGKDRVPLVTLNLPGQRVVLRLRGGQDMKRQLAGFRQIVEGAKRGEAAFYRKNKHCMLKMVAHFPVTHCSSGKDNVLLVRTHPDGLWVAEMIGTHPRYWNQDHVKSLVERHQAWLQGVSEDTKREKRVPRQMCQHIDHAREDRCRKQNDRLDTFCHEMSKQLVEFAVRQKVGKILYRDDDKSWLPRFPWFKLREKVKYKCKDRGIEFVAAKEKVSDDPTQQRKE